MLKQPYLSNLYHPPTQMEKALVSLALKTEEKTEESKDESSPQSPATTPSQAATAPQLSTALKGVSQSLVERVRSATVLKNL